MVFRRAGRLTALAGHSTDGAPYPGRTGRIIPGSTTSYKQERDSLRVENSRELKWIEALAGLPKWHPPQNPVLVIAPHPDDETLGAGGLIHLQRSRSIDFKVAAVTDGEQAYRDKSGLAAQRRSEQTEALRHLNVEAADIIRLELPDSAVATRQEDLENRLLDLVTKDIHVVAPWRGDFHPDHQACGFAAERVAEKRGAMLSS